MKAAMPSIRAGRLALACAALVATIVAAPAAEFPERPVTLVTSAPAGGGGDVLTRYLADRLKAASGATFVIENKPGAAGNIATVAVTHARPDGYTLLAAPSSTVIANKFVIKDTGYDAMRDLAPVAPFLKVGLALIAGPSTHATTVKDFVAELKARTGRPMFYGVPTTSSLFGAQVFLTMTGLTGTRVNYKGMGDAASGVTAGELDFAFVDATLAIGQAKQGRVRILAVSSAERLAIAPELPTVKESGIGDFDYVNFWAVWAPAGTPQPVIDTLSGWINRVVALPETGRFFLSQGAEPLAATPAQLAAMMRTHNDLWVQIARTTNLEPQ